MISKEGKQLLLQYAAGITASIGVGGFGASIAWTSPALPYLRSENSQIPLSWEQSDWIASLFPIGLVIGYFLNPLFIDKIGRKKTLLTFTGPQIISWIMIILAKDCTMIYFARIFGGIGYGGGVCATTVYLSEIGSHENRGIFMVLCTLCINIGMLYVMILGAYLSYNYMNIAILIIPIFFFVSFIFMPDSSFFLERNNEYKEDVQMKTLKTLLSSQESGKVEKDVNIDRVEGFYTSTLRFKESKLWKLVALRNNQKALMTVTVLAVHMTFSGDVALTYYTQQMLSYSGFTLSAEKSTMIISSIRLFASLTTVPLVERFKRKFIILSGIFGSTAMGLVGVFFFLEHKNVDVSSIRWIPLVGMAIYEYMTVFGSVNLFYIFMAELFTTEVKGIAVTVSKIILSIFTFLSLFSFNKAIALFGVHTIFFMFSACAAVTTYIVYIITPETKGKRLDEIQVLLKSKNMFYF